MNELLKAFVLLDREHLLLNAEKAARVLGVYGLVAKNSNDQLWALANTEAEPDPDGSVIVGSEPVVEIATEDPEGGQRPGVRPTVKRTRTKGR